MRAINRDGVLIHNPGDSPQDALLSITSGIKIAQKPYTIVSLGPKALKYEFFEGKLRNMFQHIKESSSIFM